MTALWRDVQYGIRLLRRHPGFASVAVIVMSLGIGANTATFGIVNALLPRPACRLKPMSDSQPQAPATSGPPAGEGLRYTT
jgi:hypothetical protein